MGKDDIPVAELLGIEDRAAVVYKGEVGVNANTTQTCFMNGLPKIEYAQEIWDIGLMETCDRDEIIRLVQNRHDILTQGKKKGSSGLNAFVAQERGNGRHGGGGRGKSGRGRGGRQSGREGGNDSASAGKNMDSVTCWRCQAKGHYSDN